MAKWVRVAYQGREYFGKLEGETVRVHSGNMFAAPEATPQAIPLAAAKLLTPSAGARAACPKATRRDTFSGTPASTT